VHQRFQDAGEFVDAVQALGRRIKPNTLQRELFPAESLGTEASPAPATKAPSADKKNHGRV
jgi:hypothetical protein